MCYKVGNIIGKIHLAVFKMIDSIATPSRYISSN